MKAIIENFGLSLEEIETKMANSDYVKQDHFGNYLICEKNGLKLWLAHIDNYKQGEPFLSIYKYSNETGGDILKRKFDKPKFQYWKVLQCSFGFWEDCEQSENPVTFEHLKKETFETYRGAGASFRTINRKEKTSFLNY